MQLYARLSNVYMYITLMNKNIVDIHGLTYPRLLPYRLRGSVPAAVLSPIPLCPIQSRPSSPNALCNPSLVDVVHRVSGRPRVAPRNWATAAGRWGANQTMSRGGHADMGPGHAGMGSHGRCPFLPGPMSPLHPTCQSPAMGRRGLTPEI